MDTDLPNSEQRNATITEFFKALATYEKKDVIRRIYSRVGTKPEFIICRTKHPATKADPRKEFIGWGTEWKTRVFLLTDYFVFLTRWTPSKEHKANVGKEVLKALPKAVASEYVDDLTWGISSLLTRLIKSDSKGAIKEMLSENAEIELTNPWSLILPIRDINVCELIKVGGFLSKMVGVADWLHIQVNHGFEGSGEWWFQIGKETDKWYSNIKMITKH